MPYQLNGVPAIDTVVPILRDHKKLPQKLMVSQNLIW